jgi:hypothetical protein
VLHLEKLNYDIREKAKTYNVISFTLHMDSIEAKIREESEAE